MADAVKCEECGGDLLSVGGFHVLTGGPEHVVEPESDDADLVAVHSDPRWAAPARAEAVHRAAHAVLDILEPHMCCGTSLALGIASMLDEMAKLEPGLEHSCYAAWLALVAVERARIVQELGPCQAVAEIGAVEKGWRLKQTVGTAVADGLEAKLPKDAHRKVLRWLFSSVDWNGEEVGRVEDVAISMKDETCTIALDKGARITFRANGAELRRLFEEAKALGVEKVSANPVPFLLHALNEICAPPLAELGGAR
jgi:hypothetical protein